MILLHADQRCNPPRSGATILEKSVCSQNDSTRSQFETTNNTSSLHDVVHIDSKQLTELKRRVEAYRYLESLSWLERYFEIVRIGRSLGVPWQQLESDYHEWASAMEVSA